MPHLMMLADLGMAVQMLRSMPHLMMLAEIGMAVQMLILPHCVFLRFWTAL